MYHDLSKHLIMLIDDTPEDLYISERIIKKQCETCYVITFSSGYDALNYLRSNVENLPLIPNLLFLDIHMPLMDGFEFMEEYQKLPEAIISKIKIFMLSSSFDPNDLKKVEENELIIKFLEKPLNKELLKSLILESST